MRDRNRRAKADGWRCGHAGGGEVKMEAEAEADDPDAGGGHRASAQALRDGFEALYGDKYDINVVDLWSTHSPWPFSNMPKSYFFLVKHPWLWRLSFRASEPELLHEAMFTVRSFFFHPISSVYVIRPNQIKSHLALKIRRLPTRLHVCFHLLTPNV